MTQFRYTAQRDAGSLPRPSTLRLDPAAPCECQPSSTHSFKPDAPGALACARGHQVPANHHDDSEVAITQAKLMANNLTRTAILNRGAWLRTEEIVECNPDQAELLVLGETVWGNTKTARKNDDFVCSHNIRTPENFWKVGIAGDGSTIAWLIPNDQNATTAKLNLPESPKAWRLLTR